MIYLLLLCFLPLIQSVDVSTSVFCKSECKEYTLTPDALIPYCDDAFMRASTTCGTVISCDLSEANRERIPRAQANSSCCVHTVIKEHGDCNPKMNGEAEHSGRSDPVFSPTGCEPASYWMPLLLGVLVIVVIIQSTYIGVLLIKCRQSSAQKVCQWRSSDVAATQPILLARPLVQP